MRCWRKMGKWWKEDAALAIIPRSVLLEQVDRPTQSKWSRFVQRWRKSPIWNTDSIRSGHLLTDVEHTRQLKMWNVGISQWLPNHHWDTRWRYLLNSLRRRKIRHVEAKSKQKCRIDGMNYLMLLRRYTLLTTCLKRRIKLNPFRRMYRKR